MWSRILTSERPPWGGSAFIPVPRPEEASEIGGKYQNLDYSDNEDSENFWKILCRPDGCVSASLSSPSTTVRAEKQGFKKSSAESAYCHVDIPKTNREGFNTSLKASNCHDEIRPSQICFFQCESFARFCSNVRWTVVDRSANDSWFQKIEDQGFLWLPNGRNEGFSIPRVWYDDKDLLG